MAKITAQQNKKRSSIDVEQIQMRILNLQKNSLWCAHFSQFPYVANSENYNVIKIETKKKKN